jgi:hypothetical protein
VLDPDLVVHSNQVSTLPVRPAEVRAAGRLFRVLRFTFANGKISRIDVIDDPAALASLDLAVLDN